MGTPESAGSPATAAVTADGETPRFESLKLPSATGARVIDYARWTFRRDPGGGVLWDPLVG